MLNTIIRLLYDHHDTVYLMILKPSAELAGFMDSETQRIRD